MSSFSFSLPLIPSPSCVQVCVCVCVSVLAVTGECLFTGVLSVRDLLPHKHTSCHSVLLLSPSTACVWVCMRVRVCVGVCQRDRGELMRGGFSRRGSAGGERGAGRGLRGPGGGRWGTGVGGTERRSQSSLRGSPANPIGRRERRPSAACVCHWLPGACGVGERRLISPD